MMRNAIIAKKQEVVIPCSRLVGEIMEILKREGYIDNVKEVDLGSFKKLKVYLKYRGRKSVVNQIKKVSRPGRRRYVDKKNIPSVLKGYGLAIVSTSKGVVSDREAKELGVGGEVVCYVW